VTPAVIAIFTQPGTFAFHHIQSRHSDARDQAHCLLRTSRSLIFPAWNQGIPPRITNKTEIYRE
jgi:hypothetical protein